MRLWVVSFVFVALVGCRRAPPCETLDPVSRELCGPRKEWVGQWIEDGRRHRWIDIGPHGGYRFGDASAHHERLVEGDIVGFAGNDLRVRTTGDRAEELVVSVADAPHEVGGHWTMVVMGVTYARSAP